MGLAKLGSAPRGLGAAKRARSETGAKTTTKKSLKGSKAAKAANEASASEAAAWLAEHDVSLSDPDAPAPCVRLADAPFPAALVAKLVAQPGFSKPTAVQGAAWPVAAAGDDLLAISRTGSGKTLSYLLPALTRSLPKLEGAALVAARRQSGGSLTLTLTLALTLPLPLTLTLTLTLTRQSEGSPSAGPTSIVMVPTRELALQVPSA